MRIIPVIHCSLLRLNSCKGYIAISKKSRIKYSLHKIKADGIALVYLPFNMCSFAAALDHMKLRIKHPEMSCMEDGARQVLYPLLNVTGWGLVFFMRGFSKMNGEAAKNVLKFEHPWADRYKPSCCAVSQCLICLLPGLMLLSVWSVWSHEGQCVAWGRQNQWNTGRLITPHVVGWTQTQTHINTMKIYMDKPLSAFIFSASKRACEITPVYYILMGSFYSCLPTFRVQILPRCLLTVCKII